ncbi:MAG TPA: hypothetical protein PK304_02315 [Mobilitalea sp.]|nr:hypothetical protein [Mobilitalea sp.]
MFSELKKLQNILIFFSGLSVLFSLISAILVYDNRRFLEFDGLFFILCCLIVLVPIGFIILTVALNRIVNALISREMSLIERIREIEKEQEKQAESLTDNKKSGALSK